MGKLPIQQLVPLKFLLEEILEIVMLNVSFLRFGFEVTTRLRTLSRRLELALFAGLFSAFQVSASSAEINSVPLIINCSVPLAAKKVGEFRGYKLWVKEKDEKSFNLYVTRGRLLCLFMTILPTEMFTMMPRLVGAFNSEGRYGDFTEDLTRLNTKIYSECSDDDRCIRDFVDGLSDAFLVFVPRLGLNPPRDYSLALVVGKYVLFSGDEL